MADDPKRLSAADLPGEANRKTAREGGSRVYDKAGNLISIDGQPVGKPKTRRATRPGEDE